MVHEYRPDRFFNVIGGHPAALEVRSGDTIATTTIDAHGVDAEGNVVALRPNPLTGPFGVAGAQPGDCLAVRIEELMPNRTQCWTRRYVAPHLLEPGLLSRYPELNSVPPGEEESYVTWTIHSKEGRVVAEGLPEGAGPPPIPLAPMLGCIGTAPADGQAISTATSGPHGGNMDYVGVRKGATLYFPVFVEGGMLYLGDGHATQGHGEIGGTGTEVSMDVRIEVRLIKKRSMSWPRGEDAHHIFTLGNARPLDQALQHATTEMFLWLLEDYSMNPVQISLLLAQAVEYEVGNVFDPAYTMACKLSKQFLPSA